METHKLKQEGKQTNLKSRKKKLKSTRKQESLHYNYLKFEAEKTENSSVFCFFISVISFFIWEKGVFWPVNNYDQETWRRVRC